MKRKGSGHETKSMIRGLGTPGRGAKPSRRNKRRNNGASCPDWVELKVASVGVSESWNDPGTMESRAEKRHTMRNAKDGSGEQPVQGLRVRGKDRNQDQCRNNTSILQDQKTKGNLESPTRKKAQSSSRQPQKLKISLRRGERAARQTMGFQSERSDQFCVLRSRLAAGSQDQGLQRTQVRAGSGRWNGP